jgi:hypothetical protein
MIIDTCQRDIFLTMSRNEKFSDKEFMFDVPLLLYMEKVCYSHLIPSIPKPAWQRPCWYQLTPMEWERQLSSSESISVWIWTRIIWEVGG